MFFSWPEQQEDLCLVFAGENFFPKILKSMNEIFSDNFARRNNFLTQVDARIKMVFAIAAILTVVSANTAYVGLIAFFLVMVGILSVRVPFKIIILRLSAPLGIAITVFFIKIFFSHQGLASCLLLISKIIGSTALLLFLSMTTSFDKLVAACGWFKIPATWVEICLIAYSYIFVLFEDAVIVFDAQRVRLGYTNWMRGLYSMGALAGTIIIRAYDQSIATYEAMCLRGYKGKVQALSLEERLMLKDALAAFIFVAILISLLTVNRLFKL